MADYSLELTAAIETLQLSRRVAENYIRSLGAIAPRNIIFPGHLGTRTGFQKTILNDIYWFAKLYELITYFEIRDRTKFTHPGFVMHFIPVFYGMYYDALQTFEKGGRDKVPTLWRRHFEGPPDGGNRRSAGTMSGALDSIVSGVTAHVRGDMATALEVAYKSWNTKPKPAFNELKNDFFEKNRPTFESAKGAFFIDLQDKGPFPFRPEVGQMMIGYGEKVMPGGLDIEKVYGWREEAWNIAGGRIIASALADVVQELGKTGAEAAIKGAVSGAKGNAK